MKLYFFQAILFVFLFNCQDNSLESSEQVEDNKTVRKYQKTKPEKTTWSLYLMGKHFKINKNGSNLTVENEKEEVVFENIKFIKPINNSNFQVLNNELKIEYYDSELTKLKDSSYSTSFEYGVCGNVPTYGLKIIVTNDFFKIKKAIGHTSFDFQNYRTIDSFENSNINDIYFTNKKRVLEYNDNFPSQENVIIEYESNFGIWSKEYGIEYFDSIDLSSFPIKIIKNNLYGYYNISPPIYLELESFEFNLARFVKIDSSGKNIKGFIDKEGYTYYK